MERTAAPRKVLLDVPGFREEPSRPDQYYKVESRVDHQEVKLTPEKVDDSSKPDISKTLSFEMTRTYFVSERQKAEQKELTSPSHETSSNDMYRPRSTKLALRRPATFRPITNQIKVLIRNLIIQRQRPQKNAVNLPNISNNRFDANEDTDDEPTKPKRFVLDVEGSFTLNGVASSSRFFSNTSDDLSRYRSDKRFITGQSLETQKSNDEGLLDLMRKKMGLFGLLHTNKRKKDMLKSLNQHYRGQ